MRPGVYPAAAPSTINRQFFTPVSAILNFAADQGLCEYRRIRRPKQPGGRTRFFLPDEAEALIDAAACHAKRLVTFLIGTGARTGEALRLQWRDVYLNERRVALWDGTKNGEMRGVPLSDRVRDALANLPHGEDQVFRTDKGHPYVIRQNGGGQIRGAFAAAIGKAGLEYATPHSCRHTWATWFYASTLDPVRLMQYGGWKKSEMIQRYVHLASPMIVPRVQAGGWSIDDRQGLVTLGMPSG